MTQLRTAPDATLTDASLFPVADETADTGLRKASGAALKEFFGGGSASYPDFDGHAGDVLAVNATEDGVEWIDPPEGGSGGGGSVPVPALASARYWRMHNVKSPDGTPSAAEIQFRASIGGAAIAPVAVTSTSNNGDQTIDKAFDGNNNTVWSAGRPNDVHIVLDFGTAKTIAQIAVVSRSDVGVNANLRDFDLYYSNDGLAWEHAGFISLAAFDAAAQTRVAAVPLSVIRADTSNNVSQNNDENDFNFPDLTGFAWVNQRGASVAKDKRGSVIASPQQGGGTYTQLLTAAPNGDFDVYGRVAMLANQTIDFPAWALCLRSSAAGRGLHLGATPGNRTVYMQDVNDGGGFNGNRMNRAFDRMPKWYRLSRRGTVIFGYASETGLEWNLIGQYDAGALAIDQQGISFIPSAAPDNVYRVLHFGN